MGFKANGPGCPCCGGGIPAVGCPCATLPATINVVWSAGVGNQGYTYDAGGTPYNATIVYGPAPGPNIQAAAGNGWYSTASFDDYGSAAPGYTNYFYYRLFCSTLSGGGPSIQRVYESYTDAGGTHGFLNLGSFVRWVITGGNTCSPFSCSTPTWGPGMFTGTATVSG